MLIGQRVQWQRLVSRSKEFPGKTPMLGSLQQLPLVGLGFMGARVPSKQMQPSTCIFHAKEVADSIKPF